MKKALLIIATALGLSFMTALPATVPAFAASPQKDTCESIGGTYDAGTKECKTDGPNVQSLIKTFLKLFTIAVGIVAVIMIIVGGLKYITSGGDSTKITNAKHTIMYALVGLVIAGLAQFIVQFVIQRTVTP